MCEITITNLHDQKLNQKLWLLMGTIGSKDKHDDGWGVANQDGDMFKCGVPMHWTTNAGEKIAPVSQGASMLLGHIRDASTRVPVNDKNAHPFQLADITFVHNGKLTPKDEKNYVMEEQVPDIDDKTRQQRVDKDGNGLMKWVGRSDSLIFFEDFIQTWTSCTVEYATQDEKFVAIVKEVMDRFYGKFALVFIINGTFYICRGKTAELNISYMLAEDDQNSEVLGWAINTGRPTLDTGTVLLSNLNFLDTGKPLHFTYPTLLKEETIFVAEDYDIREIGTMKENYAPVKTTIIHQPHGGATTTRPFTQSGGNGKATQTEDALTVITKKIYDWMEDYSMSPQDIQILLEMTFEASMLDVTTDMLEAFYKHVLVKLANRVKKKTRKSIRRHARAYVGLYDYNELNYPWMLNTETELRKLMK